MDQVKIGDVLENGSEIFATMIIKNKKNNQYLSQMYKFENGTNNTPIYVTDGHLVKNQLGKFIYVKDHPDSVHSPDMNNDSLICFITNDHIIKIANYEFGDWEDEGTLPNIIAHTPKI